MSIASSLRLVGIPAATVIGVVALAHASFPFARAVQIALVFVLLVDLATIFKGWMQNTLVVLASLSLGIAIVEGVAEVRLPRITETNDKLMWEHDANLGVSPARAAVVPAKLVVEGRTAYDVKYTIGTDRLRHTVSNANGMKVRFFGDSYTFGEGLNDADTLPQQFADMSGANVANFGYPSYSPAQALRALELGLYDDKLKDVRLLVLQTGPYQVERLVCLPWWTGGHPKYVEQGATVTSAGACPPASRPKSGAYQLLVEPRSRQVTRSDVEIYLRVVERIVEVARQKYHAPVLVLDMAFDSGFGKTGVTKADVEKRFRAAGAMVVDDTLDLTTAQREIPDDGHPNALANKLMARKAIEYLAGAEPELGITLLKSAASPEGPRGSQPAPVRPLSAR